MNWKVAIAGLVVGAVVGYARVMVGQKGAVR